MITANKIIKEFTTRKLTLALAESVTCGLAAHTLAGFKGAGDVLTCSIVAYSSEMKSKLLNVPDSLVEKHSAESHQVTRSMARGLKRLNPARVCAAVTGLASAGGSETKSKPVGTVFYAVIWKNKVHALRKVFRGSPLVIRKRACEALFRFILEVTEDNHATHLDR